MEIDRPVLEFCQRHSLGSKSQKAIIQCVSRGMNSLEIAKEIGTTKASVENILSHIYKTRGINGRVDILCELYQSVWSELQEGSVGKLEQIRKILG